MNTSTADRFAALSGEQRVRLLRRLVAADRLDEIPAVVPPRDADGPVLLSPAQEDLWTFESLYPDAAALNLCCAYHFDEPVRVGDVEQALTIVQEQHDILRMKITGSVGDLRAEFPPAGRFTLERIDLRHGHATLHETLTAFSRRRFDLGHDRLIRGAFITVDDRRRTLVLALHHIATDWWSFDVLHTEFVEAYRAVRAGQAPRHARPRIQYGDFAAWQRELEASGVFDAQLRYWRDYLADPPAPLLVDGGGHADPDAGHDIEQIPFHVDARTEARVRAFAREHGATVYGVLMTAFAVLAYRLSGQADFVVGTPSANRSAKGLERVIGYVMNAVPTRWRIGTGDAFVDLLRRFTAEFPAVLSNADVPVGRIVSAVNPQRMPGRSPLFQWVFMHLPRLDSVRQLEEIVAPERVHTGGEHDVVGIMRDTGDGIAGTLEIRTDIYPAAVVRCWADSFVVLLDGLLAEPDVPVGTVPLLSAAERRRLTVEINDTGVDVTPASLADLVARRALRTPDAVAVETDELTLTYAGLIEQADRLADRLRTCGVGRERLVALALRRSVAMVVALLAVQRAGGAYLPVDPDYPAERIRYLFDDAAPVLLVTDADTTAALPDTAIPRLVLDPVAAGVASAEPAETPPTVDDGPRWVSTGPQQAPHQAPTGPHQAGYVMYTSGSTGRPKGVLVSHSGIASLAESLTRSFALTGDSRVLQLSSSSFDISVGEMCMAFGSGGTLVIPPPGPLVGQALADVLHERRITCTLLPPAVLASVPPGAYPHLRTVCVGADVCPPDLVTRWASGERRFLNAYGPTEFTVAATVSDPLPAAGGSVPIGRPIINARTYVLDARLRPVPVGVPGELYLAGESVVRGYLGQPGATAERFVADPYAPRPGARMYRTGDLVRWRPDGQLDFLGRTDDQVKLRGFRIEPAEIEAVLSGHDTVARAVVLLREDTPRTVEAGTPSPADRRLVAYLVAGPGAAPDTDALLAHAVTLLPGYMVPSAFVWLDDLPMTSHGKLDRRALPAPSLRPRAADRAPVNSQEELLCAVYAEVLGVAQVGVNQDFFDLGGDSIMAILLVGRANAAGLGLSLRDVFVARTPAGLAAVAAGGPARPGPEARETVSAEGRFPLLPIMHWWREHTEALDAFTLSAQVPVPAGLDQEHVASALRTLVQRHGSLRMRLIRHTPDGWELEVPPSDEVNTAAQLTRVDVIAMADADIDQAMREAAARDRLSPEDGRMLSAMWFDRGTREAGRLLLTMHHLAADVVSVRILAQELTELLSTGRIDLPTPATSLRAWSRLLRNRAGAVADEFGVWERVLSGPEARLAPERTGRNARATLTLTLPPERAEPVLTRVPAVFRCGPDDVLLTALLAAALRWRGWGSALLVERETHGRDAPIDGVDVSRTVGWLTSQFPVRLDAGQAGTEEFWHGGAAAGSALKQVKEQLRAIPADGLSYGLLRYLNPQTASKLAALPHPDVTFNYLGRFDARATGGVRLLGAVARDADNDRARDADNDRARDADGKESLLPLTHLLTLDVAAEVGTNGPSLIATWSYAASAIDQSQVRRLAEHWFAALDVLARHAAAEDAGGATSSDFPLVDLTQDQIEALEADLADLDGGDEW